MVEGRVEHQARTSGRSLPTKRYSGLALHVRICFDTFLARGRPGLGEEEGGAAIAPRRRRNRKNKNKVHDEDIENSLTKTLVCEETAWRTEISSLLVPDPGDDVRAF